LYFKYIAKQKEKRSSGLMPLAVCYLTLSQKADSDLIDHSIDPNYPSPQPVLVVFLIDQLRLLALFTPGEKHQMLIFSRSTSNDVRSIVNFGHY
jgi:hypothetical protein